MLKNGPATSTEVNSTHWSHGRTSRTLTLLRRKSSTEQELFERLQSVLNEAIGGGSEHGQLILLHPIPVEDHRNWFRLTGDGGKASGTVVLLEVNGHQVSGFTRKDLLAWIVQCLLQSDNESGRTVQFLTAPITGQYLNPIFPHKNILLIQLGDPHKKMVNLLIQTPTRRD